MKNSIPNRQYFKTAFFYFSIALCLLSQAFNAPAQAELKDWTFVYFERHPHVVWGCPFYTCRNTVADPQPQTKIAYASDYYYFTQDYIVNNLDRNLFATLSGGVMMGGNYESSNCRFGTWGYGTFKNDGFGVQCANSKEEISATFSQPVFSQEIYLKGKYPQRLIVTESGQPPVFVDLSPDGQGQTDKGIGRLILSGKKITGLTVKSADASYAFSVDYLIVKKAVVSMPNPGGSPPNYCNVTPQTRPAPENLSGYDWTMRSEVSDVDGLVLSNVRLKGRLMAERISVPYYKIETSITPPLTGELRPSDSGGSMRSRLVSYSTETNDERLVIKAVYSIDSITSAQSCLSITQRYEFLKSESGSVCAPDPTGGHLSNNCNRWRAAVTYDFKGNGGETLRSLNVAQRNHFRVNDKAKNSVGLFRDCDFDPLLEFGCLPYEGIIFKKKLNPLFSEHYSVVAANGQQTGSWDNIHQTYRSYVSEPLNPITAASKYVAGGCPECVHSHWRWGQFNGEPFNNGNLYLPSDSNQDMSLGVVRYRAGEEHPHNFLDLINTNPEPIRSKLPFLQAVLERDSYQSTVPEEVVFWSSATGHKSSDEFFGYYSFFNTDEPNVTRPIGDDLRLSITKEAAKKEAARLNEDKPTSIVFGHLHEDGMTTYGERDADLIASLPDGYLYYNGNMSYDIRTEARVSGPHTVTFNVPSVADQTTFGSLRILHSEPHPLNSENAIWVDRTILSPNTPAPDFANRTISAKVNEVGPFVLTRLVNPPPPNTNVADLSVSMGESADPVTAGNDLIYTVNVTNNSADMATGTIFSNGLSPDVSFVSADAGMARFCREENGTVLCDLSWIAPGVTIPVVITVRPNEGMTRFPPEGKSIFNTAFVVANESDPNENNNMAIESTTALPNPNAPPTVQVLSPADALLTGPATFSVIVGAADSDGTISQVELFDNGVSVGNGTFVETGKYSVNLSGVAFGEHSFIAVATDNGGRKALSGSITVFVNGPAIVNLSSPTENSVFGRPANIALTATADYAAGSISKVEFFANGTLIGNGMLSGANQYNLTWNNAPTGTFSVRAVATDNNSLKTYSATAKILVTNAPTVVITSPAPGASYPKNTNITFAANSRDFDGYVAKVEFFYDGASLGMGTLVQANLFTLTWGSATVGTHTITATATDNSGKTSTSSPVSFTITNIAPTVNLTSPANGATFTAPANVTLSANASDGDGRITKVEFFKSTTLLSTILNPPYNFSWTNVIAGNYSLTAKATDDNGAATTSNPVTITVNAIGNALLVVGNTTLNSTDNAIKTRLQNLGLNVVIKSATAAVSADATGKRVVVISDTVSPTNVNTKFRAVATPVVTLDPQLFDDMGMTAATSGSFGTSATQKNVTITNAAHPMAAGLSGTVQVTSANTTFGWGIVNANAAKIATLTTDATKATDFSYASGAVMPGLTAPAKRVGFFYTASSAALTTNGGLLFDNAIKWAAGL